MSRRRIRQHRAAFTLVELLIVVAIIALLVSILLPALRSARQQAKCLLCQSNLHQLAVAWHQYLDEHRGSFLQGVNVNYNYGGAQGTHQMPAPPLGADDPIPKPLNRHLKLDLILPREAGRVFRCPCDVGGGEAAPSFYEYYGTSYMTNMMLVGQDQLYVDIDDPVAPVLDQVNERLRQLNISRVDTNHAELLFTADGGWWNSTTCNPYIPRIDWHGVRGGHNVAFLDGHVSFARLRKGLYVTSDYTLIPFRDLAFEAARLQVEVPDP